MTAAGVPCVPGYHGANQSPSFLQTEAEKTGFPVLIKAVKGGGGKGMRIALTADVFKEQLMSAKSEARSSFGDDAMLVEKYITTPRHIEVQVFADKHGNCVALGERDCSIQRRHQKILEESPAPHLAESTRQDLWAKARAAALAVGYEGAGTVEFIFDNDTGRFFFMEMNTRLQVEHPVTEMVTGEDLVHWQIIVAQGGKLPLSQSDVEARIHGKGHAIEARIYAEDPELGFIPDSGRLLHARTPQPTEDVRIDAGFIAGDEVSSHYDPMIAKLIVRGADREEAIQCLRTALAEYEIAGPSTNIEFLKRICSSEDFVLGKVETGFIEKHRETLFAKRPLEAEVFAQAALAALQAESMASKTKTKTQDGRDTHVGFGRSYPTRRFSFVEASRATGENSEKTTNVIVRQTAPSTYSVETCGMLYTNVYSQRDREEGIVQTYFPHTRIDSTVIEDEEGGITIFQRGKQYRLRATTAKWMEKALGIKNVANSVVAPMPCKVLRVEVQAGDMVRRDQALVVIESMKMETVIRSPQDGRVSKVVHQAGVRPSPALANAFAS